MTASIAEAIENLEENADGTVEVPKPVDQGADGNDTSKDSGGGAGDKAADGASDGAKSDTGDSDGDDKKQDGSGDGAGTSKSDDDKDGYVADELEDKTGDETKTPETPKQAEVSPELQFIIDGLPTLTVRGKQADGSVKTFNVKAAGQLPDDFEFASKREEMMFVQALSAQENKAQALQAQYQRKQQDEQASKYTAQENADIRSDIADLQRSGDIPKFKYPPTDKRFNDDYGVKQAQEVMEFMNEKNQSYAKAGKLYRVSFKDAFAMMNKKADNTDTNNNQAKEDKERTKVTRQMAGSGSASSRTLSKPRPAASMEDLINRIDSYDL